MQLVLACASLGLPWPPRGLEHLTEPDVAELLIRMGVVVRTTNSTSFLTTRLGEEVLQGDMDVGANLLVAVSKKMGIEIIGTVAAAFVACKRDLFADLFDRGGCVWTFITPARARRERGFLASSLRTLQ